ncbi:glycogen synthase [Cetobacterium sp. SF1]|uniref:glycogen synthase n=1 Tax=Cetobacterium sp. SF1 TaxID=3417654 RepID=UPI003CE8CBD3
MKVLFVTSEAKPFIKTGGLGDVAQDLPIELKKQGIEIKVIMPKYSLINNKYLEKMNYVGHKYMNLSWRKKYIGVDYLNFRGIDYYFIDNEYYFNREKIYGEFDDCERFAFFSKGIYEVLDIIDFKPDIIHCNDWHSGLVPVYKDFYEINPKIIFTIHNLRYQGVFGKENIEDVLGLNKNEYFNKNSLEFNNAISFMKGGINYSNLITTVSKSYVEEIKTEEYGEGLDGLFREYSWKLKGILNGIDKKEYLPHKSKNNKKLELQKKLGLEENLKIPIISIITRLDRQKGLDIIIENLEEILSKNIQFILLGTGDKKYEDYFYNIGKKYKKNTSMNLFFNEKLAKEIYEGSDLFLMPSYFEPCGLSQMIAMNYGTLPLVREVGGLKDTVEAYDEFKNTGTGFSFKNYSGEELIKILNYALEVYRDKKRWNEIKKRAKKEDNSWSHSAKEYISLYKKALTSF